MEKIWNYTFYFVYRTDYKLHLLFNKINPFRLLFKLPHSKRQFAKLKVDPMEAVNEAFKRPDIGISSIRATGAMYVMFFFICLSLINMICASLHIVYYLKLSHLFILIAIALITNYFLLFRHDKYLAYFKDVEKMSKPKKKKWAIISLIVVSGIVIFTVGSFIFWIHRL
jgi:virulence family protein